MYKQAARVIALFGSPYKMTKFVGITPGQIYKWTWEKERGGTGGLIPTGAIPKVIKGAKAAGLDITAADLYHGMEE